jgi:hypothetical protein
LAMRLDPLGSWTVYLKIATEMESDPARRPERYLVTDSRELKRPGWVWVFFNPFVPDGFVKFDFWFWMCSSHLPPRTPRTRGVVHFHAAQLQFATESIKTVCVFSFPVGCLTGRGGGI